MFDVDGIGSGKLSEFRQAIRHLVIDINNDDSDDRKNELKSEDQFWNLCKVHGIDDNTEITVVVENQNQDGYQNDILNAKTDIIVTMDTDGDYKLRVFKNQGCVASFFVEWRGVCHEAMILTDDGEVHYYSNHSADNVYRPMKSVESVTFLNNDDTETLMDRIEGKSDC